VPMSWPTEYARHLDVRTTSIYPLPKMSPDRALGHGRASIFAYQQVSSKGSSYPNFGELRLAKFAEFPFYEVW
jgi:hypothetical protein